MKKILLLLICISTVFFISACGSSNGNPTESETASSDLAVSGSISSYPVSDGGTIGVLWDSDGVHSELLYLLDENGQKYYAIKTENSCDYEIELSIVDPVINNDFSVSIYPYSIDAGTTGCHILNYLSVQNITSFEATIEVLNYETFDTESAQVSFSSLENVAPSIIYSASYGALAKKQVILDNDSIRATLLGAGSNQVNETSDSDFSGLIHVENKSQDTHPVKINSICINGITIENTAGDYGLYLPSGLETMIGFKVPAFYLEDNGINSIYNIAIQLLTDEEEITGYNSTSEFDGGTWYDIELSSKGEETEQNQGQCIFEDESIAVYCLDEIVDIYDDSVDYEWPLKIVNKTNQDISIQGNTFSINGKEQDDDLLLFELEQYAYLSSVGCIRANNFSYTNMHCTVNGAPTEINEVSATFTVYNSGQSKLLYQSDNPIVITRADLDFENTAYDDEFDDDEELSSEELEELQEMQDFIDSFDPEDIENY